MQIAGIIAGVYLSFRYAVPALVPFLLGWMLAAWANPWAKRAERKFHISRTLAGSILILAFTVLVLFLAWRGLLEGISQLKHWLANYQELEKACLGFVRKCCQALEESTGISSETSQQFLLANGTALRERLMEKLGSEAMGQAAACVKWLFAAVSGTVITVISAVFILKDMESLKRKVREYSVFQGGRRILRRLKETTAVYFKAQLLIMAVISVECAAGFWLLKSPYYLLLGIVIGFLDALPLIGTGLFLYPAAVVYLLQGQTLLAVGCVLLELLTSFTRQILEPRLLGKGLGVYPIVILGAVYLGLLLYGAAGVILGPLSFSLMYEIGKEWDVWD